MGLDSERSCREGQERNRLNCRVNQRQDVFPTTPNNLFETSRSTVCSGSHLAGTVGDQVADGLKTGGEYAKAGIQNTGEAVGLKGSKV